MAEKVLPVFVYGTLRKGFGNYNNILKGNTVMEFNAETTGILCEVFGGGFPAMVEGGEIVKGELMFIDEFEYEQTLQRLDRLEGYHPKDRGNSMYLRETKMVKNELNGESVEAWTYIWNGRRLGAKIPSGCYKQHTEWNKQTNWGAH
jgi:gamma-glutamylcyclotransferase (GGCT)/AIG2-like uncharacterized protein YtfP